MTAIVIAGLTGILNLLEKGIRLLLIEDFVAVHDGDEVLGLGEVDDVVGVAGEHVDGLDVVAGDLELNDLVRAQFALLDEAVSTYHNEELPLGVVPVLAFGDAGTGDIDGDLAAVEGVDQLGEGAAVIDIHLEREGHFLLGQVAEVGAVELLGKGALRDLGD